LPSKLSEDVNVGICKFWSVDMSSFRAAEISAADPSAACTSRVDSQAHH
jgi:hypothetical protein